MIRKPRFAGPTRAIILAGDFHFAVIKQSVPHIKSASRSL